MYKSAVQMSNQVKRDRFGSHWPADCHHSHGTLGYLGLHRARKGSNSDKAFGVPTFRRQQLEEEDFTKKIALKHAMQAGGKLKTCSSCLC